MRVSVVEAFLNNLDSGSVDACRSVGTLNRTRMGDLERTGTAKVAGLAEDGGLWLA